jgi:hypothetical protein
VYQSVLAPMLHDDSVCARALCVGLQRALLLRLAEAGCRRFCPGSSDRFAQGACQAGRGGGNGISLLQ